VVAVEQAENGLCVRARRPGLVGLAAVEEHRPLYPLVRDDRGRVVGRAGIVEHGDARRAAVPAWCQNWPTNPSPISDSVVSAVGSAENARWKPADATCAPFARTVTVNASGVAPFQK
jgi:hypothetical protein